MKKTKKLTSVILSIIMLISMLTGTLTANANSINQNLFFGVTTGGRLSGNGGSFKAEDYYKFSLSSYTTLCLDYDSEFHNSACNWQNIKIIKAADYSDYAKGKTVNTYFESNAEGNSSYAWCDKTFSLYSGSYYLIISSTGYQGVDWYIDYQFSVTPTVNALKNLKASTTNSSAKLSWTGDLGAKGYQIQQKTSNGYKNIKTTTSTSYTIKSLSSACVYTYRVRGYNLVDNKKYYGKWKTVTAVTKPSKVSIKAPTTNSKHQIIAKWNKQQRVSGYQVQYCKNKNCSNVIATKTVSGQSKTSYTGKNFTKSRTYYVRVRAYKTVNNKKYYGSWSSVKSIKCK